MKPVRRDPVPARLRAIDELVVLKDPRVRWLFYEGRPVTQALDGTGTMTMKRALQSRRLFGLSIFVAAIPFAFALVRAVRTGYDLRYFWVALGSLLGAMATIAVGKAHIRRPLAVVALVTGVFVIATLLAVLTASLIGTTLGLGIVAVGSAFGLCFAIGALLHVLARPRTL